MITEKNENILVVDYKFDDNFISSIVFTWISPTELKRVLKQTNKQTELV